MESSVLKIENFAASFGEHTILKDINLSFSRNTLTAIMGPSGCGKTTLIRCINRMHELVPNAKVSGKILLDNEDIYNTDPIIVRRQIGMVFQRPNPFPTMSIYDNVIAGYNLNGIKLRKEEMDQTVEESLKKAALWEEVKDALHRRGSFLSGGQQQRVLIARALAQNADLLLLDEPLNAVDVSTRQTVAEVLHKIKDQGKTVIVATHYYSQEEGRYDKAIYLKDGQKISGRDGE